MSDLLTANVERAVTEAVDRTIAAGARRYRRDHSLARLIRVDDLDLADTSTTTRGLIVARLDAALAAERNRANAGIGADYHRAIAIRQAIAGETSK